MKKNWREDYRTVECIRCEGKVLVHKKAKYPVCDDCISMKTKRIWPDETEHNYNLQPVNDVTPEEVEAGKAAARAKRMAESRDPDGSRQLKKCNGTGVRHPKIVSTENFGKS